MMVDIVIPIYKVTPSADDCVSIRQTFAVLKQHCITFIHPKSLDLSSYKTFGHAQFQAFDDYFFDSIQGYNSLLLNADFYKTFAQEYMLICQTDAYVFKDDLDLWCNKNYDYIGAPWLRSHKHIPLAKKVWENIVCSILQMTNYHGNQTTQKNKALLYNAVGNGGFSLRKREKMIAVLEQLQPQVQVYLNPKNTNRFFAEDVFFSIEPQRHGLKFNKPSTNEACNFAIENKPELALALNAGHLPMGCHRWNKENRLFWKHYIDDDTERI